MTHDSKLTFEVVGRPQRMVPEISVFAGGEVHVVLPTKFLSIAPNLIKAVTIHALLASAQDVMALLLVADALRRHTLKYVPIHLVMPYVPYARQDRVCNPGEAFGAKVFCQLINATNFDSVTITDPHSDVAPALLDRVVVTGATAYVRSVLRRPEFSAGVILLAPDAGASKKVSAIADSLVVPAAFATKERNSITREVKTSHVPKLDGHNAILVVDDICDGGRTFIELAKAIREQGYRQPLYLYVTHGIFSWGLSDLLQHYSHVFTAHSWSITDAPQFTVVTH